MEILHGSGQSRWNGRDGAGRAWTRRVGIIASRSRFRIPVETPPWTPSASARTRATPRTVSTWRWHFEGTALWDTTNEWVELTGPFTAQAGTAFQTSAAVTSDNVVIEFEFYASGGSGADGISLTALDVDRMTSFVGGSGGGLGYLGLPRLVD